MRDDNARSGLATRTYHRGMAIPRPCLGIDGKRCPNMAAGGRRGPRCPTCQGEMDRRRNALTTRHPYLDPRYRAYPIAGKMCALAYEHVCTGRATTRDHIISLVECQRRGIDPNDWSNLQPACRECNSAKRAGVTDTPPL